MVMKMYSALSDKERQQLFQDLVETSHDLIWQCDHKGRLAYLNPAWETVLGFTRDEMLGRTFAEFQSSETSECAADVFARMKDHDALRDVRMVLIGKSGNAFHFRLNSKQMHNENGQFIGARGTAQNITDQVRAESAVEQSERRFRSVLDNSLDVIYRVNVLTDRYDYLSPSVETVLTYSPGELMQMEAGAALALIHPDDLPDVFRAFKRMETESIAHVDYRLRTRSGEWRWLSANMSLVKDDAGRPLYREGNIRDISERKRTEEALRANEQRLKFHLENSPLAVVEWNKDFIVTQWSIEAERIFGWKKEETLGKRIDRLNVIYADDIPIVEQTMQRLLSGQEHTVVSSNRNYTKAGGVIECVWYNSVLLDSGGRMSSVLSLVLDITEQKMAHDVLVKHELELRDLYEQASRHAFVKTQLLNEVNHRVKNNLMVILGLILAEKRQAIADGHHGAEAMADRLEGRIKGLLAVHQMLSDSKWEPISLAELARSICRNVLDACTAGDGAIDLRVAQTDIRVTARQAGSLALVFNELTVNCMKYAFAHATRPSIAISFGVEDGRLRIAFKDNGCGYPERVLVHKHWSVGLRLIHQLVEHTLEGEVLLLNDNGAVTLISLDTTGRETSTLANEAKEA